MHIPDGYLGPYTYGGLWAAIVPIWIYASGKIKETLKASQVPFLALSAAFSFVIMLFNVPIPGGTTGHATGATLIAILIGPWAAIIAVSIALIIQSFMFGDGGITAIGANCFNIAFADVLVGYGIYRLVAGVRGQSPQATRRGGGSGVISTRHLIGAGAGAYIGINLAAFLTAFELGIQTVLHVGTDGRPLYSPFPLAVTIPAIMIEHAVLFGIVEAVITIFVLIYLRKSHPDLIGRGL
ncbi:MAG: cobalt/nickel transport system permease protein [Nitrospirae bacterium]|nr:MAG: cobalt/nickel transport system permease protein [Nitrospirota bacterium]